MPRIRCRYDDCVFVESGYCTADRIELDPELGCLTFQQADEPEAIEWNEEEETEVLDEEEEEELDWEEEDEEEDDDDGDEW